MDFLKKFHLPLIIFSLILQILLAAITYHPDLRAFVLASKFINSGEVFTFYDHVSKLPSSDPIKKIYGDDIFIYPPLAYLIPAAFYAPVSPFLGKVYDEVILRDSDIYQNNSIYPSFLLLKLPSLFFAFLTLLLLPKLFTRESHSRLAQLLWVLNPTTILVGSFMGQVDNILTFFLLASFLCLRKRQYWIASVFIALSALIKPTGLVLLPLMAIYVFRKKGFIPSLRAIIPGALTWIAVIAPFIFSPAFRMYALFAAHTAKTTYAGIAISGSVSIPWFFILYVLIALQLFEKKISLFKALGLTVFSVLAFNHFHPQWFLWCTPFLIIYTIKHNQLYLFLMLVVCWVLIWFSFDPSLHLGAILSLKQIFPPTMVSPLNDSSLVLLARAALVGSLIFMVTRNKND